MTIYSLIYILLALILLAYTAVSRIDLLSVATVCFVVYTIYCVPGIGRSGGYAVDLSPELYYLVYVQCIIIFLYCFWARKRNRSALKNDMGSSEACRDRVHEEKIKLAFQIYTWIIVAFAGINIVRIGFSGFAAGKANVWEQANILYIISLYGAYPSFAYGLHTRTKSIWLPSLFVELTIFFSGSRAFATTLAVIFLCERGTLLWRKRKKSLKLYVLGAIAVVFLLMYRMIDQQIMAGDFSGAIEALSRPETWLEGLEFNEPRVIIANYDYVITHRFRLPAGDVIYRIIDFIPGATTLAPIKLQYPEYFSAWLQKEVVAVRGVGGSIWGENYAMFGVPGVFLFTLIWLWFIDKCNKHLDYHADYSYFVVALGSYFAWYINRLEYNLLGQACKVTLFCFLIWALVFVAVGGKLKFHRLSIRLK